MKHWWKILSVLLVGYALVAGLGIPLKPGILAVSPDAAKAGQTLVLDVQGYNSHYEDAKELRAWLKLDSSHYVPATLIHTLSQNQLKAEFNIPYPVPGDRGIRELTLIMDNEIDGYSLLPGAVYLEVLGMDTILGGWASTAGHVHDPQGFAFPYRNILYETIRNLFYHVPLWFAMIILFFISAIYSGIYLLVGNSQNDHYSLALNQVGILYGVLGLATGAIWASWTWGKPWSGDVKQNMSAIAMLVYLAYLVLRSSFNDYEQKAKTAAVYNIFAFVALIPLLFVIPRLYDSLHPGNGGNPGFGGDDLDHTMRLVFYPAIIGFTLLGLWMAHLAYRFLRVREKWLEDSLSGEWDR